MADKRGFERYLGKIQGMIDDVRAKQAPSILKAAEIIAASLGQGGILHVFGTSHSQLLAQEVFYRAGCLVPTNAMIEPTPGLRKASENCYWYERQEAYGKVVLDSYQTESATSSSSSPPLGAMRCLWRWPCRRRSAA